MSDTARERRAPAETAPRPLRIASDILFAVYLAVLLRLTVFRDGFSFDNFMLGGSLNLTFFDNLIDVIRRGGAYYFIRLLLGNIAAFVPMGAYIAFRTKMRIITVILIGAAASAAIELMQFAFDAGVTEIDDVIHPRHPRRRRSGKDSKYADNKKYRHGTPVILPQDLKKAADA